MVLIRSFFIILALVSAFGCTAVKVRPVDTELEIKHVCIKDGQQMCFDGEMMGVIRDGFERHGITTQIYTDSLPSECEYHLSYMCNQTWDMAMYMHHAELHLYRIQAQIGYAEYHLKGGGGFSPMKWESTKKKMDPVIDELLSSYPIVNPDLYTVQSEISSENTTEATTASLSSEKIDPIEPWTGVWFVDGGRLMGGTWGMKQSGSIVKSTEDSYYEFKGKIRGNQLEGKIKGDYDEYRNFVITLSSDGLFFQGKSGTHHLKGRRKTASMASVSPVSLNTNEPWTGNWKVEGFSYYTGRWGMKQTGKIVKSTEDSYYEFEGKVSGNQLKGRLKDGSWQLPIAINMSSDGLSFEGTIETPHRNGLIKGKRE